MGLMPSLLQLALGQSLREEGQLERHWLLLNLRHRAERCVVGPLTAGWIYLLDGLPLMSPGAPRSPPKATGVWGSFGSGGPGGLGVQGVRGSWDSGGLGVSCPRSPPEAQIVSVRAGIGRIDRIGRIGRMG